MNNGFYVVQPGDAITTVAQKTGASVADLRESNQLADNRPIVPGEVLLIPPASPVTTNTSRACGIHFRQTQVAVAQMVWAGHRPVTIYLAPSTDFGDAVVASALQHHPQEGPLLLTHPAYLDPLLRPLLRCLSPTGHAYGATTEEYQIVLVGNLGVQVEEECREMGFTVGRIHGENAYATADRVARQRGLPRDVVLICNDPRLGGQIAASTAAHEGAPILLAEGSVLPPETQQTLLALNNPRVHVVGTADAPLGALVEQVQQLGVSFVDMISGRDLIELAINFSRYKSPEGDFGWGKTLAGGHAFSFVLPDPWQFLVSSSSLSHRGKHTPFLYVLRDRVPAPTSSYIVSVNPETMDRPPFMHGLIIGSQEVIGRVTQTQLQLALSVD